MKIRGLSKCHVVGVFLSCGQNLSCLVVFSLLKRSFGLPVSQIFNSYYTSLPCWAYPHFQILTFTPTKIVSNCAYSFRGDEVILLQLFVWSNKQELVIIIYLLCTAMSCLPFGNEGNMGLEVKYRGGTIWKPFHL